MANVFYMWISKTCAVVIYMISPKTHVCVYYILFLDIEIHCIIYVRNENGIMPFYSFYFPPVKLGLLSQLLHRGRHVVVESGNQIPTS